MSEDTAEKQGNLNPQKEPDTVPVSRIFDEYQQKLRETKTINDLISLPLSEYEAKSPFRVDFFGNDPFDIIWDFRFDSHRIYDNEIDSITQKINELRREYSATCARLGLEKGTYLDFSGKDGELTAEQVKNRIELKQYLANLLRPGNYVAHGAFISDLPRMIQLGGLTSSVGLVNAGLLDKDKMPRWSTHSPGHPHKSAVFFYHWSNPEAGSYTANYQDFRGRNTGSTDMCIIYPTEDLIDNAGAVIVEHMRDDRSLEIGATNSPTSIKKGELVDSNDDRTLLPLEKSFLIVPDDKVDEVRQILTDGGYSQEWIDSHVRSIGVKRWEDPRFGELNDMGEAILADKEKITKWLRENTKVSERRILISRKKRNSIDIYHTFLMVINSTRG